MGALVLVLGALFGAGVATADPADPVVPDPSSTTTTTTATTLPPTTTTVPPSTTTTVAPRAVEPVRPAPTTSTTLPAPSPDVATPLEHDDHDEGGCTDGEFSDLPTTTDLNGQHRVLLGRVVQFEVHVRKDSCAEHAPPTGVVQLWRLRSGDFELVMVDQLTLDSAGATLLQDDDASTPGTYTYWAEYLGVEGGWTGDDGPYAPGYLPSTSEAQDVEVVGVPTRVLLFSSTGYLYEGNDLTLTALVETVPVGAAAPKGFVTFYADGRQLNTVQLNGDGVAQTVVTQPSLGEHTYAVYYDGYDEEDGTFGRIDDPAETTVFVDEPPAPIVQLTSDPASGSTIEEGTPITFTSSVLPPWTEEGGPMFPGSVGYFEDGELVGSAPVGESYTLVPGAGSHAYTAAYEGYPGWWSPSEASNVVSFTVQAVATTSSTTTSTTSTTSTSTVPTPTTAPPATAPPTSAPPSGGTPTEDTGAAIGTTVGTLTTDPVDDPAAIEPLAERGTPRRPTTTTTTTETVSDPAIGRERAAGIVVDVQVDQPAERSELVFGIPDPRDVDWSGRHVRQNLVLTLLLILLIALPAELFNSTLKEHYHRVNRPLRGIQAWLAALEAHLLTAPNGVLLVGFALVGAAIASQLDPSFGLNATSMVLFSALALAFVTITLVLELARIPYLDRRAGRRREHHLRLFPLVLILGAIFVVVSRLAEFRPGYVFGITCGLLLADDVGEEDNARSLVMAAVLLLATSLGAWLLWLPLVDEVQGASPSLWVLFGDAFLATLWISCLQVVVFGYAPLEALYGKIVQRWSWPAWIAIYGVAVFLLVSFLLHPSAGRWGGLTTTTFLQMMTLFVVFLVASVVLWAWFRFRPDPIQKGADEAPAVTSDQG
ncbi:MAG: Ig-like domain repeat protein [Acidimicrobiales bacterium]|nr:Ig-like domain repeat protein [Acidimicrobiales bacterium]